MGGIHNHFREWISWELWHPKHEGILIEWSFYSMLYQSISWCCNNTAFGFVYIAGNFVNTIFSFRCFDMTQKLIFPWLTLYTVKTLHLSNMISCRYNKGWVREKESRRDRKGKKTSDGSVWSMSLLQQWQKCSDHYLEGLSDWPAGCFHGSSESDNWTKSFHYRPCPLRSATIKTLSAGHLTLLTDEEEHEAAGTNLNYGTRFCSLCT